MPDDFESVVEQLAQANGGVCVTAAAGCGKTEAIVRAAAMAKGKQLILTHTNAGVAALHSRFRRYSVQGSKYRVETIASWLLRYASAYRSMSGLQISCPQRKDWNQVYPAAQTLFNFPFVRDVLQATYAGMFVDEYQDCTQQQHQVILKIGEHFPLRLLGDPLQGIFGFHDDPLVDWKTDVATNFPELPNLIEPHRWGGENNPKLGKQLAEIREMLVNGIPINLEDYSEIRWKKWSEEAETEICQEFAVSHTSANESVAGIHSGKKTEILGKREHLDRITAKRLAGKYQCIEEMDCYSLMDRARYIDGCLSKNNQKCLKWNLEQFLSEGISEGQLTAHYELQYALAELQSIGVSAIPKLMDVALKTLPVFRRELFNEMKRAALEFATGRYATFQEAAYAARTKTRVSGRKPEKRIISRTLLIKGLEFDHAIVLNADKLQNRENFYVAMTRGSKSLTVLSQAPVVSFPAAQ